MRAAGSLIVVVLTYGGVATAEPLEAVTSASQHQLRAEAFFRGADYRAAIRELEAARSLDPQPEQLYNIAVCYERLGELERALLLLEQFQADPAALPYWHRLAAARLARIRTKRARGAQRPALRSPPR